MDERISRSLDIVKDLEGLNQLEINIRAHDAMTEEVAASLRSKAIQLGRVLVAQRTGLDLDQLTPAEERIVDVVSEYVTLMKRRGKPANRTLQQIEKRGLIEAAEIAVSRSKPTQGFETLHEEDREDLSYEQIVIDHPEEFSPRALWYANRALGHRTDGDRPPASAGIPAQLRTENLLDWLKARATAADGYLGHFTNAEAARAIGMDDLSVQGRAFGNIQSRLDFACYRLGLPPLGLAAEAPFQEAWGQEDRSWRFPVASMQSAAQRFRWQERDFDRLMAETAKLSGRAYILWKAELRDNEAHVRAWAEGLEAGPLESSARASEATGSDESSVNAPAYWVFVCNPAKWAIDEFLATGTEVDTWGVRPSDADNFAPGQLGIVRVGVDRRSSADRRGRPLLEPGIYALCEVESAAFEGTGANDSFWAEGAGREPGWPTVRVRYLRSYLSKPLTIEILRGSRPDLSPLLLDGFQAASFPLAAEDFHAVLEMLDEDVDALPAPIPPPANTLDRLAQLEAKYLSASPEVKLRTSKSIERGPIGTAVKKATGYKCQLCEALGMKPTGFVKVNGDPYVEAHHVMPVSKGQVGSLSSSNIMTLCANHHRQLHYGDGVIVKIGPVAFTVSIDGTTVEIPKVITLDDLSEVPTVVEAV